jgi:hypothetical protein
MKMRLWVLLLILVLSTFSLSGCYYFSAKDQMKNAEMLISDLKARGGEKMAPYEYCSAEAFLEISRGEFGQNDFKASKEFAERSKAAAQAGLAEAGKKK